MTFQRKREVISTKDNAQAERFALNYKAEENYQLERSTTENTSCAAFRREVRKHLQGMPL